MAKEILYRIEFEGAKQQLDNLEKIAEQIVVIEKEKIKANKDDIKTQELLRAHMTELQKQRQIERKDLADQAKAMKVVSGSLEDLRLRAKKLGQELERTDIGTKKFKDMSVQLNDLNTKIRTADKSAGNFKSNIGNYAGSIGDAFSKLGVNMGGVTSGIGTMASAAGPLGLALGAVAGAAALFGKAIQSTDVLADQYAITMAKADAASQVFFKSLAEGDFSNFLTNMRLAIRAAEEYAIAMDDLADRSRALNIQESKARVTVLELRKVLMDVTKTETERIAAADKIIAIEKGLAETRKTNAENNLQAELKLSGAINQINKDKLRDLIENYDQYTLQFENVQRLQRAEKALAQERAASGGGASGFEIADPAEVRRLEENVNRWRNVTAAYSKEVIAFGRVSEEERVKIATAATEFYQADASFRENTLKIEARRSSLLDEINRLQITTGKTQQSDLVKLNAELKKFRDEAVKVNAELIKMAQALSGGVARNTARSRAGGQFVADPTIGGMELPKNLIPKERKGAGKVNLGGDEDPGFDVQATTDAAAQFVDIWGMAYDQRAQRLQESLDKGLISESKFQKETEKLQKRANNLQRISTIAQLTGDMAKTLSALGVGVANTAKIGFPQNIPMLIAFAAQAAGIIMNLRSIKFAEGGLIAGGKPHSQGGTKYLGSDGSAFEAEQGEYIAVVNKHDTKRLSELSHLNSKHGRPFYNQPASSYFAAGGVFMPNQNIGNSNNDALIRSIVKQIGSIPVEVSLNEIEKKSDYKRKVNAIGGL